MGNSSACELSDATSVTSRVDRVPNADRTTYWRAFWTTKWKANWSAIKSAVYEAIWTAYKSTNESHWTTNRSA